MIDPLVIDALIASGATAEMVGAVVKADQAAEMAKAEAKRASRRAGNAERQRRFRNASNAVTPRDGALCGVTERDEVSPEVSPKDNNQTPILTPSVESERRAREPDLRAKAEEFYAAYPKKVDPPEAKKRFIRVVKSGVDPDDVISAAKRFAEAHRLAGTDRQFIPAAAVWLNRGGYASEDLPEARAGPQVNGHAAPGKTNLQFETILDSLADEKPYDTSAF